MTTSSNAIASVPICSCCSNLETTMQLCEQNWIPTRYLMQELLTGVFRVPVKRPVSEEVLS